MSTQQQTRSGDGGGRNKGKKSSGGAGDTNSNKKSEVKTEKEKNHPKPTAEQIRIAQIVEIKNDVSDDPKIREKVANLMEMTQRSEEEVCCALNECDNDLERAAIFLLETLPVGAFETSSKKKKNRLTSVSNDASGGDGDWNESSNSGQNGPNNDGKERSRSRGGIRGGRGGTDSRGWRGRENRENDRNNVSSENKDNNWRGGGGGRGGRGGRGGGYGGRGGRGGRMGPRGTGPREYNRDRNTSRSHDNHQPEVDTWDTNQVQPEINTWGDWDNEEYTGSLADSKVFTPSVSQSSATELSAPPGLEQQVLNPPSHPDDLVQQYSTTVVSSTTTAAAVAAANNAVQFPEIQSAGHLRQSLDLQQQINSTSSSLSAEQSQYFNSLTSQNNGQPSVVNVNSYQPASVQYSSQYGNTNSYVEQIGSSQPQTRKPPRARVPPPSKIPSTAVEMPGDTLNNIQYLDVQFGGLDFGTEESFDSLSEKFNQANLDPSQNVSQTSDVVVGPVDYQTKQSVVQQQGLVGSGGGNSGGGGGLQSTQIADNLASYTQRTNQQPASNNSSVVGNSMNNTSGGLDQLSKNDHYNQSNQTGGSGYQTVPSYQNNNSVSVNKASSYQQNQPPQGYTNSNYSNTQVSSNSNYSQSSTYSTYNPTSVNSYQQQSNNTNNPNSGVNSAVVNSVGNSGSGVSSNNSNSSQSLPVNNSNANSNSNAGYLSSQYPSVSQTGSGFPSQQSGYQNSQSVYGGAGLSNNTGYSTNSSATQYGNFNSTKLKDTTTPVSTPFESVSSNVSSSAPSSVSNSAVTTSSMSSPSLGLTNTKVTNSTAKGTGGVVQNIPMVSQYIQAGMPFYQPPVYSFEEIQMMQQRMPHVPGYYDINYQTPTSLGAAGVRDGNMASVAYSTMSDARFTRTDNNSSPVSNVPSTMSQQTGSGGPVLNVPYAYAFYGGMPGSFQYGGPAIYPQQMATASATSGGQFPKQSYNSGYGSSGYDAIGQTAQDYSKGGYPGSGIGQQSKGQTVSNPQSAGTGSDISSSMYGKSHVALNKVNSYDNKSFHSGTPPPFNLAGTQTAGATSAQFSTQHLYIPTMPAPHHSMNMHQQMHQMDGRIHNNNNSNPNRRDSSSTGQRQPSSSQGKTGTKQGYSPSYWTAQN